MWEHFGEHVRNIWKITHHIVVRKDPEDQLQEKLKLFYQDLTLPRVAWLGERKEFQVKNNYFDLTLVSCYKSINIEHIFFPQEEVSTNRILISGRPGYGKTTLFYKLMSDWAREESYISHFKYVFYVPLRQLNGRTVEEALFNAADACGFHNPGALGKILQNIGPETLLLLDGFDELASEERENIINILYKKHLKDVVVMVSSRYESCVLTREESIRLFAGICKSYKFEFKKVEVKGIASDSWKAFLRTFYDNYHVSHIAKVLYTFQSETFDVLESPLLVITLADLIMTKVQTQPDITVTELYKSLVNLFARSSHEQRDIILEDDFDIFNLKNKMMKMYQIKLYTFGGKASRRKRGQQMQFQYDENVNDVYQLGILVKYKSISVMGSETFYEPYHPTLLDFIISLYIWLDYHYDGRRLSTKNLLLLRDLAPSKGKVSLIHKFVLGLFGDEAHEFFIQSQPYSYVYNVNQILLWHMLGEVKPNEKLMKSIQSYLPSVLHNKYDPTYQSFYTSPMHNAIVEAGIKSNVVKAVVYPIKQNFRIELPQKVTVPFIYINVEKKDDVTGSEEILERKIECRYLFMRIYSFNTQEEFHNILRLFASFSTEKIGMDLADKVSLATVSNMLGACIRLDHLTFSSIKLSNEEALLLNKWFKKLNITSLICKFGSEYRTISDFLPNFKFNFLSSIQFFSVTDVCRRVSLEELISRRGKQLQYLTLKNVNLFCSFPDLTPDVDIRGLSIKCNHNDFHTDMVQAMLKLTLTLLECKFNLLEAINDVAPDWQSYKSITQLSVILFNDYYDVYAKRTEKRKHKRRQKKLIASSDYQEPKPRFPIKQKKSDLWNSLTNFIQLEVLKLKLDNELSLPLDDVLNCLNLLAIKHLLLWQCNNDANKFAHQFVGAIQENKIKTIKTVQFQWAVRLSNFYKQTGNDICDLAIKLMNCLQKGNILKVGLIFYNGSKFFNWVLDVIDHTQFDVKYDVYGQQPDDPELDTLYESNNCLDTQCTRDYSRCTITLRESEL